MSCNFTYSTFTYCTDTNSARTAIDSSLTPKLSPT